MQRSVDVGERKAVNREGGRKQEKGKGPRGLQRCFWRKRKLPHPASSPVLPRFHQPESSAEPWAWTVHTHMHEFNPALSSTRGLGSQQDPRIQEQQ